MCNYSATLFIATDIVRRVTVRNCTTDTYRKNQPGFRDVSHNTPVFIMHGHKNAGRCYFIMSKDALQLPFKRRSCHGRCDPLLAAVEHDLEPMRKDVKLISGQWALQITRDALHAAMLASTKPSRRLLCTIVMSGFLLTSCAPGANLKPLPTDQVGNAYRLGTGDQVRVITFGGDQLTGEFRINDSGNIAIPLLGSVHAAGLTTAALGETIATDLQKKDLLKNPSVSVEVIAYRPFFILGEVTKPGEYPYEPGMTVLTAVSIAGGFTYRAVTSYASIIRTTSTDAVEGRVDRQTLVKPGDVITIFERRF